MPPAHRRYPWRRRHTIAAVSTGAAAALIAALMTLATTAQAATAFSANFEDGSLNGWSKSGGTWSVVTDGTKVLRQAKADTDNARVFAGDSGWRDYTVQARVKPLSLGSGGLVALLGRASGSTTYYRLALGPGGVVALERVSSGAVTELGSVSQAVSTGTWYTLSLSVHGGTVSGSIDGTTVASVADSHLAAGRIGLQTSFSTAEFDDVTVDTDSGTPSPSPTIASPSPTTASPTASPTPSRTSSPTPTATGSAPGGTLYVAPGGSDTNAGTLTAPLASIAKAVSLVSPGGTIAVRGGTYALTTNITIAKSGTASAPITLSNYGSERVVIDAEALPYTPGAVDSTIPAAQRGAIHMQASYWRISGLEIEHGPYAIYCDGCDNNTFDRLVTHDNYETGFQLQGSSAGNLIVNLDSYNNRDPRKNGESADGLGIKQGSGAGNVVRGARLWNNVDDGFDAWEFTSPITIQDSVAYGNGYNRWNIPDFSGDGNGFKLGGSDGTGPAANHSLSNVMSWSNAATGFTDNGNTGTITVNRCTAWANAKTGFDFDGGSTATLTANLAVGNATAVALGSSTGSGNSWDIGGTWTLLSTDPSAITGTRGANGAIPSSNFLVPANGAAVGAKI
ncbi:right-handed parallel beta-helix repeat-containing protein [Rugosimonospora africana]|uniref:Pectate lyase n=1 Tax=Rugosimonospora africana TaxID=556532 RepID=A0A8J3VTS7_9ACTN|nr:right-handed parallel beta-helix repeat-containing protein [Rugosimonospora africana]GIH17848.1 hypothetical protein Raf01_60200 [Rugosimonospora africana]